MEIGGFGEGGHELAKARWECDRLREEAMERERQHEEALTWHQNRYDATVAEHHAQHRELLENHERLELIEQLLDRQRQANIDQLQLE